jgi:hypothetical protein
VKAATMMSADAALAFVETHGVVLVAARGPVPRLVEAIAGEPIKGSWWAHPQSHGIFAVLQALEESGQLLQCRLFEGKATLVHRRLWPALVRLEERFAPQQLAQIKQEHTASGKHVNRIIDYPGWVPASVRAAARALSDAEAERVLAAVLAGGRRPTAAAKRGRPTPAAAAAKGKRVRRG